MDIDALLLDVAQGDPCGPDLEYDPDFLELEQAVLGKPEVQYGDTVTPAVPPEWKVVRKLSHGLLQRSRDLRLTVALARAELALAGIAGLADCLNLVERLLEERWDHVHPQLDADDDMDPMLRINSLAALTEAAFLREVREISLLVLPGLGPFSLRDLDIANGDLAPPEGQQALAVSSIEAAMLDAAAEPFDRAFDALQRAHGSAVQIEVILVRQVGSSQAFNLDPLTKMLLRGRDFFAAQADSRSGGAAPAASTEEDAIEGGTATASSSASPAARAAISGDIASRADVIRMLDKINRYYQQYEPSSPVPLLLERARRLVPKNFFEIMEDLAPGGMTELLVLSGPRESDVQQDEY